jgi:hemerythrin superfamily protein
MTPGFRNIRALRLVSTANQTGSERMPETKTQDAIALLKQDHREVEQLFEDYEKASGDGRKRTLAEQICLELSVHAQIEEEIFYPACEGKVDEDLLKESYVEHDGAKVLIAEIMAGDPSGDEFYDAKVQVLSEEIKHHVEEEERRMEGLFAQARKAGLDMDALGDQLAARKAELTDQFKSSGIPEPKLTTMDEVSV